MSSEGLENVSQSLTTNVGAGGGQGRWGPVRTASHLERKDQNTETSSRAEGGLGARRRPALTFLICKEIPKAEDLGHEDPDGDEELGHHSQGPSQVLRGQLP